MRDLGMRTDEKIREHPSANSTGRAIAAIRLTRDEKRRCWRARKCHLQGCEGLLQLGLRVHLDRKLERMLTMLLRLKDLRRATVEG